MRRIEEEIGDPHPTSSATSTVTENHQAPSLPAGYKVRVGIKTLTTTVLADIQRSFGDV